MKMSEWLRLARKEQRDSTDEIGSHLYANYKYTRRNALIEKRGLQKFVRNVSKVKLGPPPDEDEAGRIVYKVAASQYKSKPKRGDVADFRLMGRRVRYSKTEYFANIVQELLFYPPVTAQGGAPPSTGISPTAGAQLPGLLNNLATAQSLKPGGVLWLTAWNKMLEVTQRLRPETREGLFVCLFDWLGLKPKGYPWRDAKTAPWQVAVTLRLYRATDDTVIARPHALSGGYSDRFCCATVFPPYGSTAQCSTGVAFLPEAVTAHKGLVEISPQDAEYDAACAELEAINNALVAGRARGQALSGVVLSSQFAPHNGYLMLQRSILARL